MQLQPLPGFRDFYPGDLRMRDHIFAVWRRVAARYALEEYDGPPLEPLRLYTEKSGAEIVGQLYNFEDKGGREVALRPEMTPTMARMVGARAAALKKPIRWFSVPQLFRYERQQRGRLREHFQFNVDIIGETSPLADAEVIAVAADVLRELGLDQTAFRIRISDRRVVRALLTGRGVPEDRVEPTLAIIDKIERESEAALREKLNDIGIRGSSAEAVFEVARIRGRSNLEDGLAEAGGAADAASDLLECVDALDQHGLGEYLDIDCSVVRGLAYYTGVVFELFDASGSLRAICGGGRYDRLLASLGGPDLPAVGFGMGDVVLAELLRDRGLEPESEGKLDIFVAAVSDDDVPEMLRVVRTLRDHDLSVEYALRRTGVGRQMKLAGARNARLAVVVGPDEREAGAVVVKDLASGQEERQPLEDLGKRLSGRLKQA